MVETDFSKFDGTISNWLREYVEIACYTAWVSSEYKTELRERISAELSSTAVTTLGVRYLPGGSRLSGSPLTTDGNTLINAFVTYCALRESGYSPQEAWDALGIYAGDDGLSPGVPDQIELTAKCLGLSVKAKICCAPDMSLPSLSAGSHPTFLARIFYDPWNGAAGSIQDPLRMLSKIHLTTSPNNIPIDLAAIHKLRGILLLDPDAPIISEWSRRLIKIFHERHFGTPLEDQQMLAYVEGLSNDPKIDVIQDDLNFWVRNGFENTEKEPTGWPQLPRAVQESLYFQALKIEKHDLERILERIILIDSDNLDDQTPFIENEYAAHTPGAVIDGQLAVDDSSADELSADRRRQGKNAKSDGATTVKPPGDNTGPSKEGPTPRNGSQLQRQQHGPRKDESHGTRGNRRHPQQDGVARGSNAASTRGNSSKGPVPKQEKSRLPANNVSKGRGQNAKNDRTTTRSNSNYTPRSPSPPAKNLPPIPNQAQGGDTTAPLPALPADVRDALDKYKNWAKINPALHRIRMETEFKQLTLAEPTGSNIPPPRNIIVAKRTRGSRGDNRKPQQNNGDSSSKSRSRSRSPIGSAVTSSPSDEASTSTGQ